MAKRELCLLYLTCENTITAGEIVKSLLAKRLIVCAKQMPISSNYWTASDIEQSTEVLLIMESALDLFDKIEKEVARLHTYKTFVLESVPISQVSADAAKWLETNLKPRV